MCSSAPSSAEATGFPGGGGALGPGCAGAVAAWARARGRSPAGRWRAPGEDDVKKPTVCDCFLTPPLVRGLSPSRVTELARSVGERLARRLVGRTRERRVERLEELRLVAQVLE